MRCSSSIQGSLQHQAWLFVRTVLVVIVGSAVRAGSVIGFQFGKNALWRQTTASPGFSTADAVEWGAGAAVLQFPFDTAENVTVSESATGASFPMTAYTYEDPVDAMPHEDWWGSATFESRDALLAVWPAGGTAQFGRTFPEWLEAPPDSGSILLNAIEPVQIPEFTNFDAIQAIDPSQDFTFQWTPWTNPTGYIPFNIYGPDGEVGGAGLDGSAAEFIIAAGTLQAGVTYRAVVNFSSGYFHTGTEWEGEAVGWHYWNYRTEVEFTPKAPSRSLPELPTSSEFSRWRPLGDGWPDSKHGLGSLAWFQGELHTGDWGWGDDLVIGLIPRW
ncbi:MAG: hypothetical protein KDM81_15390, partial [Verrucomicrobiae bacterium]|nr:hypothetical protein [Verrucomicrobiae bacterium]